METYAVSSTIIAAIVVVITTAVTYLATMDVAGFGLSSFSTSAATIITDAAKQNLSTIIRGSNEPLYIRIHILMILIIKYINSTKRRQHEQQGF